MIEIFHEELCKACSGSGVQHNTVTGLNELCSVCGGKGKRYASNYEGLPPGTYCMNTMTYTTSNLH